MATTHPTIELLSTQKVLLSTAPKRPGENEIDTTAVVNWSSSNAAVGVDIPTDVPDTDPPVPNTNNLVAWITTPAAQGSAVITAKVTGSAHAYTDELQPITYAAAQPGTIGLSAGNPVSE